MPGSALYAAISGMKSQQIKLDVIANNVLYSKIDRFSLSADGDRPVAGRGQKKQGGADEDRAHTGILPDTAMQHLLPPCRTAEENLVTIV